MTGRWCRWRSTRATKRRWPAADAEIAARFGRLDIVVNNAGISGRGAAGSVNISYAAFVTGAVPDVNGGSFMT